MEPGSLLEIIGTILSTCRIIYKRVKDVKTNKERCQQIAQRVRALEDLVLNIKRRGPRRISSVVKNALKELCITLESAQTLMMKYTETSAFMGFLKSSSHKDKFYDIDKRLSDHLHVLSAALVIEQGNIQHKMYNTVRGRRRDEECYSEQENTQHKMYNTVRGRRQDEECYSEEASFTTPPASMYSYSSMPSMQISPVASSQISCIMSPTQIFSPMMSMTSLTGAMSPTNPTTIVYPPAMGSSTVIYPTTAPVTYSTQNSTVFMM